MTVRLQSFILILSCLLCSQLLHAQSYSVAGDPLAHTYSIVARDTATGEMAVAVQSHWFSVGTIVSWGSSGVGVVATQSFVNPVYGTDGLDLMARGKSAEEALQILVEADRGRDYRQVAFLDASGMVSAYTRSSCFAEASHALGDNYSAQANNGRLEEALPVFGYVFDRDANWRELTRRLPASGLLSVSETDLQKMLKR